MTKKSTMKVERLAKTGEFVVRNPSGGSSVHKSGKETPKVVRNSLEKNREALRRLADR